jgi:tetratricopeptide (TPR) repeat protein
VRPGGESLDASLGRAVAGYEILAELGRGTMGVVYHARQLRLNRLVALKMVLAGAYASEESLTRFRLEAEAVARLQHPHIVQIYEVGEQEGRPFFSMEYIGGGSLAMKLGVALPSNQEAAQLCENLARAVHYAHERGVVHRDLKPANILLMKDQQAGSLPFADLVPKVVDFGLAKQLDGETLGTASGAILGTPGYMAPEQASGLSGQIGPAADIYALGAILYHLLTGRPPFQSETVEMTLNKVRLDEPAPPTRLRPKVARDLQTICLKCLEKEPRQRYTSAAALADDLQRFLDGEPLRARPVTAVERTWKWIKRRPTVAALLMVSALAVVALFVGMVAFYQLSLREADRRNVTVERDLEKEKSLRAEQERSQATNAAQRAEKEARRIRAATGILFDGFTDEDPLGLNGNFIIIPRERGLQRTLADVLKHAAAKNSRRLNQENPDIKAEIEEITGTTFRKLGMYEESEERLKKALELRLQVEPRNLLDESGTRQALGLLYHQRGSFTKGDYEAAKRQYDEALRLRSQLEPPDDLLVSETMFYMAWLHTQNEEFAEAEKLFQRVRAIRARPELGASLRDKILVDQGIVAIAGWQGKDEEALIKSLPLMHRLIQAEGNADEIKAFDLFQQGLLLTMMVKSDSARRKAKHMYQESCALLRSTKGRDHFYVCLMLYFVARVSVDLHEYEEAERAYAESWNISRAKVGFEHPMVPYLLLKDYARLLAIRGKRLEAVRLFEEVAQVKAGRLGPDDFQVANTWMILSTFLEEWQDDQRLEAACREALRIYERTGKTSRWLYPDCLERLARLCRRQRKPEEASRLEQEAARVRVAQADRRLSRS